MLGHIMVMTFDWTWACLVSVIKNLFFHLCKFSPMAFEIYYTAHYDIWPCSTSYSQSLHSLTFSVLQAISIFVQLLQKARRLTN